MSNERVEAGAGTNFKNIQGGKDLNALSLFSGIGGLDLAAEMAGIEVIGFCEIEPFPVEVLTKRFPGVPIFEDVRKLTKESFMEAMKAVAVKGGDAHERAPEESLESIGPRCSSRGPIASARPVWRSAAEVHRGG